MMPLKRHGALVAQRESTVTGSAYARAGVLFGLVGFLAGGCSSSSDNASESAGAGGSGQGGSANTGSDASTDVGGRGKDGSAGSGGVGGSGAAGGAGGAAGQGGAGATADTGAPTDAGDVGDSSLPGDTYLPWAGGPSYFSKWTNGPPADPSFFPIAVWLQSPPNADAYKMVGINLFVGLYEGPTDNQLSTLKTAGIPTFCDQGGVWASHKTDKTIWGWLQPDEPDNAQAKPDGGGYDPCIAPSVIETGYNTMVSNDATRPVWLGLGRGVSDTMWGGRGTCTGNTAMYADYAKGGDILSFDIYPVNGGIGLEAVPNGVDNLRMWSNYEKPVVADIEGSDINDTTRPTPAQIKSEIWMALVHGAAGIQYFCHRFAPDFSETDCLDDATTKAALPGINGQVTALAPVLNTQSVGNGVTTTSSDMSKPVDTMLKRYQGATYLFATEMRDGMTTGTFTLRGLPHTASAEAIGENRTIALTDGVFHDDFSSYGVHLYKITY